MAWTCDIGKHSFHFFPQSGIGLIGIIIETSDFVGRYYVIPDGYKAILVKLLVIITSHRSDHPITCSLTHFLNIVIQFLYRYHKKTNGSCIRSAVLQHEPLQLYIVNIGLSRNLHESLRPIYYLNILQR